ncbi:hypothetical protein FO440_12680 [Mucilaginibacter corticis]|uniref:Uncharacterized protein n=1 Tax=Mucilaginibacter corticis TaxID=2597670 RepID=A0A556MLD1_9SPHI|nr:hypothetical protein [Mucilaginibacter corticis]TSJ40599.1 hypothetical protein FO440_12680 [Mucilaginibacter corticis]
MSKRQSLVIGDILSFKGIDKKYKAIICTGIYKDHNPHYYEFAATTYSDENKPSLVDIINSKFYGVGNNKSFDYSKLELDNMWKIHPEVKPYYIGSYGFLIWKKDLRTFYSELELVGNINIVHNLAQNGNGSVNASSLNFLRDFFAFDSLNILLERGQETYQVKSILLGE